MSLPNYMKPYTFTLHKPPYYCCCTDCSYPVKPACQLVAGIIAYELLSFQSIHNKTTFLLFHCRPFYLFNKMFIFGANGKFYG